jgi:peptidoglycan hydrolase-like protein with peptidoglycan-binding domain
VAATCGGGAEKVTEGTGYTNPRWAAAKPAMQALAPHGFVPGCYLFLDASASGAAQAAHFAAVAGDLAGFAIAVDLERAPDGSPTRQQAVDAAAELRRRYPRHPIGGYAPHWYTGGEDLTFFDWLWASEYVTGSGDPGILYSRVPASWWAPYGGRSPLMLQFTSKASIAGIAGPVDCSAFHGSAAQLGARLLAVAPAPPVVHTPVSKGTVPASAWPMAMTLQQGASGNPVKALQEMLSGSGIVGARGITADGVFGGQTLDAVRAFQKARGLQIDGVAGPLTHQALLALHDLAAAPPPLPAPPVSLVRRMPAPFLSLYPGDAPVTIPVRGDDEDPGLHSLLVAGGQGSVVCVVFHGPAGDDTHMVVPQAGRSAPVVPGAGWESCTAVSLHRTDTKQAVSASAAFLSW